MRASKWPDFPFKHEVITYLVKRKRSDAVRGQLHRVQQRDLNESVRLRPSVGPVLVALHLKHTHAHHVGLKQQKDCGISAVPISCWQADFSTQQRVTDAIITISSALSQSHYSRRHYHYRCWLHCERLTSVRRPPRQEETKKNTKPPGY